MDGRILDELNYRMDEALEKGRRWMDEEDFEDFNETLEATKEEFEYIIRKNPMKSLAAGLLIGYVAGKICK